MQIGRRKPSAPSAAVFQRRDRRGLLAVSRQTHPRMFLTPDPATHAQLEDAASHVTRALIAAASLEGPRSPVSPDELREQVAAIDLLPEHGAPLRDVLDELQPILDGGIRLGDPFCVAHLHPAPLIAAAAAELAVGSTNQSMDAFDASPAATFVEDALVRRLAQLHGLAAWLGRDDHGRDRQQPARPAARPRQGGRGRAAQGAAAERVEDRGQRGLARQHPALGGAARARDRRGDRAPDRRGRVGDPRGARRPRARDRDRRHGRDDRPRGDRPARRARRRGPQAQRALPRRRRRRLRPDPQRARTAPA